MAQISNEDLESLNKLQYEMYMLAYQIEKRGLQASNDEYARRVKHYDRFLDYLLKQLGYNSERYGIDPDTGKIIKLEDWI